MASFSIPLTGLESDSTALNTIANDLSNMNTTAFKTQQTNFSDLFYQQIGSTGGGDPIQVGAGSAVATNETSFVQGSINTTGNATDVALSGSGFFVAGNGQGGYEYTRAGDFSLAANGDLLTTNGLNVMGYPATNGVVNTSAPLTAINIPVGQVQEPQATTAMSMNANLDSTATTVPATTVPSQITVYDSLGEPHLVNIVFTQASTPAVPNTWDYSASLPAADYAGVPPAAITGTMTFNASGVLTTVTPTAGVPETVGAAAGDTSSIPLSFAGLKDGANNLAINWNLLDAAGTPNITQVDTGSGVASTTQDGYASGEYQSFTIGSDGTVTASYSNGETQNVGQLALANVTNLQGLDLEGNGDYQTTKASGTASVGVSGTDGLGTLQDDALEASNVNISTEFSNLIIAQRAFEANAKSVTTFDTVTQDAINMVH